MRKVGLVVFTFAAVHSLEYLALGELLCAELHRMRDLFVTPEIVHNAVSLSHHLEHLPDRVISCVVGCVVNGQCTRRIEG